MDLHLAETLGDTVSTCPLRRLDGTRATDAAAICDSPGVDMNLVISVFAVAVNDILAVKLVVLLERVVCRKSVSVDRLRLFLTNHEEESYCWFIGGFRLVRRDRDEARRARSGVDPRRANETLAQPTEVTTRLRIVGSGGGPSGWIPLTVTPLPSSRFARSNANVTRASLSCLSVPRSSYSPTSRRLP